MLKISRRASAYIKANDLMRYVTVLKMNLLAVGNDLRMVTVHRGLLTLHPVNPVQERTYYPGDTTHDLYAVEKWGDALPGRNDVQFAAY